MLSCHDRERFVRRIAVVTAVAMVLFALAAQAQRFVRTDLVDEIKDPNLVNAWGMSRSSTSPWWISDNGTGLATVYDGDGNIQPLVVTIPTPNHEGASTPTGQVFNYTSGFEVAPGEKADFIFATEDGTISGWNPNVDPTHAIITVNRAGSALYKGLALAQSAQGPHLYATNFKTGQVEVFDSSFKPVPLPTVAAFHIPGLDQNWAAYGIQSVGGNLVVTFAHRPPGQTYADTGIGLGWVGIFDPQGKLLLTLEHGFWDNAPWGIAMAPGDFGAFNHLLLIGSHGGGYINAYNAVTGKYVQQMNDIHDRPLRVMGLWGLSFGSDSKAGAATTLYFSAGPNDGHYGLFGMIMPVADEQRGNND